MNFKGMRCGSKVAAAAAAAAEGERGSRSAREEVGWVNVDDDLYVAWVGI